MITLTEINRRHEEFWRNRKLTTDRLMKNQHILGVVAARENAKAQYVKAATSERDRIERIRHQKSFESELEETARELKPFLGLTEAQSKRAQKPRGKVGDEGQTLNQVIGALALHYPELTAKELWSPFFAKLDELGCSPEEIPYGPGTTKSAYAYQASRGTKRITFGQFRNVVSKVRQSEEEPLAVSNESS
jgi:hypothetical protein